MYSYKYGFLCGFENRKFKTCYNENDEEECLYGFKDGYNDGVEYRKREFEN